MSYTQHFDHLKGISSINTKFVFYYLSMNNEVVFLSIYVHQKIISVSYLHIIISMKILSILCSHKNSSYDYFSY